MSNIKKYSCLLCFDDGYITLVKDQDKIPYEYFFACSCAVGQSKVFNPIGKTFKNGEDVKRQVRDFRAALHQGYHLKEGVSDHVAELMTVQRTLPSAERGCKID